MDSKLSFQHISACIERGISFAAYSLPSYNTFEFILPENILRIKAQSEVEGKSGFIFHPFSTIKNNILFLECENSIKQDQNYDLLNDLIKSCPITQISEKCEASTTQNSYSDSFDTFIEKLKDQSFNKLVLSRVQFKETEISPVDLFKEILKKYPKNFNYIFFDQESGCWLGSSPEILYSEEEGIVKTVALAGTQTINESSSYKWGEKEIEEQAIVVDYIE